MRADQRGFSLIELMISALVGLMLLAAVGNLVVNSSATHRELAAMSRQAENGRFAMQLLNDEIHHAGFYGEMFDLAATPAGLPDPCLTIPAALRASLPLPIQGYNASAASPIACLSSLDHVDGTDILVLRRASTAVTPMNQLTANAVYVQTTSNTFTVASGPEADPANPAIFTLTKKGGGTNWADVRQYRVDIYYVSPCQTPTVTTCDASADGGNPIPTLKRLVLTGDPNLQAEPLVVGIENLQIEYGVDATGDGVPDNYVAAPADTTAWSNVVSVQLYMLARTVEPIAGYTDTKTYNLGAAGAVTPGGTGIKRHLFSTVARAINPATRRE